MIKILFLIRDLGQGGAEKVLVNLVNNMDRTKFDISITALFGGGVNEQFLKPDIHFRSIWQKEIPGNSKIMKVLTPKQLHKICVKESYDIEIAYLEGPSARVISGCSRKETKTICWIHRSHSSIKEVCAAFRSKKEAVQCYTSFDKIVCVSQYVKDNFCSWMPVSKKATVKYNTVESSYILEQSKEDVSEIHTDFLKLIGVGSLKQVKGFERLLRVSKKLKEEGYHFHLYLLGKGPLKKEFERYIVQNNLSEYVTLLGYQTNPYKYVKNCDVFVCSSYSEGFSTAATEALIVGTPIITTLVSGMEEMLGSHNEYGMIVKNDETCLYEGMKELLDKPELLQHYKKQAEIRGKSFSTEETVHAVEKMILHL
ncbi:MAG: glycosyltransferase [Eubacteriales bacterium]|nr:glycosyltransferase [Eubacteriales bacterium]